MKEEHVCRKDGSTFDLIRNMMEKKWELRKDLEMTFRQKAYDYIMTVCLELIKKIGSV